MQLGKSGLMKYLKEKKQDRFVTQYFNYRNGTNAMIYPLEPIGAGVSLEQYCNNLKVNKIFCYKDYRSGRITYKILEYYFNKQTNILTVATSSAGGIKSLYLTSISLENNSFIYDTRSFFSPDGIEKYMTIAKGEEWTGRDVFDDYC
ncbi:Uncharacterised protein [Mycoplasmopsis arginini]|nr:Uncharacterised protein [Mycoplasmopsis arginini]SGA20006.1 Uncharacterised protein [Mycoplasmopsis arginini]